MAYKVFTNGSPLPASDLNTYLMNQSVMVFADSTARSAALTSPTEGMTTYLENTNSIEVYTGAGWVGVGGTPITTQGDLIIGDASNLPARLAIGSNGTVLTSNGTTASWSAGGGIGTLLSTTSMSGSSALTVSSISQSYKVLRIVVDRATMATASSFTIQLRNSSSSARTMEFSGINTATTPALSKSTTSTMQIPAGSVNVYQNQPTSFELVITNYASTSNYKPFHLFGNSASDATPGGVARWGSIVSTDAIAELNITGGVNFTAGTIYIYGAN